MSVADSTVLISVLKKNPTFNYLKYLVKLLDALQPNFLNFITGQFWFLPLELALGKICVSDKL